MEEQLVADADAALEAMILKHRAGAIPALLGVCVRWAVFNGGTELVKGSLENAIQLADDLNAALPRQ